MGGSLVQAEVVYGYFTDYCDIDASVKRSVAGDVTQSETQAAEGHTFSCVTASPKQIRGKHMDVLISDETVETSDELIDSALPMVNDSKNPLVIMASTFHKIYGRFQETWDNAKERGYLRIQWDIFDVCTPFASDYWENGKMKDGTPISSIAGVEKLKGWAAGRTGDPDGWINIENIVQAWRERATDDWFEVEYLGRRPSSAGLVLKPEDVDNSLFDSKLDKRYNHIQGSNSVIGIDWGFSSMTAVVELMGWMNDVVVMVDNQNYQQVDSEDIIKAVVKRVKDHGIRFIYADSEAKFENRALQNALVKAKLSCKVVEVVFSKDKPEMLGNLRAHFEQTKFKLPKKFIDAYFQLKNYRYQEGTDKPVKKNDHIPDSTMCALQHFKLAHLARSLPIKEEKRTPDEEAEAGKPITAGILNKKF